MHVTAYEARQQELQEENQGLQSALSELQSEHCALTNRQATPRRLQAGPAPDTENAAQLQRLDVAALQAELSGRMAAVASRMSATAVQDGPLQHELVTWRERGLFKDLQAAKQTVQEQVQCSSSPGFCCEV